RTASSLATAGAHKLVMNDHSQWRLMLLNVFQPARPSHLHLTFAGQARPCAFPMSSPKPEGNTEPPPIHPPRSTVEAQRRRCVRRDLLSLKAMSLPVRPP